MKPENLENFGMDGCWLFWWPDVPSNAEQMAVILVPGFLTDKLVDLQDFDPRRTPKDPWFQHGIELSARLSCPVGVLRWPSSRFWEFVLGVREEQNRYSGTALVPSMHGFDSLMRSFRVSADLKLVRGISIFPWLMYARTGFKALSKIVQGRVKGWHDIECHADGIARLLAGYVESLPATRVFVVGHSLGGRISIKIRESLNLDFTERIRSISMAPAVFQDEVDWGKVGTSRELPIDLFWSSADFVLSVFFRLARGTRRQPLGVGGWPSRSFHKRANMIDATHRPYRKRRGHNDYVPDIQKLIFEAPSIGESRQCCKGV